MSRRREERGLRTTSTGQLASRKLRVSRETRVDYSAQRCEEAVSRSGGTGSDASRSARGSRLVSTDLAPTFRTGSGILKPG
jgi:hypothetical protein